jgi:hypothetical protein
MNPLIISKSDIFGGAARAENHLHRALVEANVTSTMLVGNKQSDDWRIQRPISNLNKILYKMPAVLDPLPTIFQRSTNSTTVVTLPAKIPV